jgi:hypothetical protein
MINDFYWWDSMLECPDKVPQSGIYKAVHDTNHIQNHEITTIMGEHFPQSLRATSPLRINPRGKPHWKPREFQMSGQLSIATG